LVDPISPRTYDRLRRATRTHREDLVVRLCGEVGLRPREVVAVRPSDVSTVDDASVLAVDDRTTVLAADLAHDLRKYVTSEGVADDEPIVDVSARRVQMLVREVADRAAAATGDDRFAAVSTSALREHFVVAQLRRGVDARVVAAVAGFDSVAGLAPYLDDPSTVEVVAALNDAAGDAPDGDVPEAVRHATECLVELASTVPGHESLESLFGAVVDRVASTDGHRYAWVASVTNDDATPAVLARAGVDAAVAEAEAETTDPLPAPDDRRPPRGDGGSPVRVEQFDGDRGGVVSLALGELEGVTYALGVGVHTAPDAGGTIAGLYAALGSLVARAFEAVRRRRLLVADVVTELRFDVHGDEAVLVALAAALGTDVRVTGVVPGGAGLVLYAAVADASPQAVVDAVDHLRTGDVAAGDDGGTDESAVVERVRYVDDGDDGAIFEFAVTESPARTLVDLDAQVHEYRVDPDGGRLTAVVPTDADVRAVRDGLKRRWPASSLVGQETVERTVEHAGGFQGRLREDLTDRQLAVLQSAYYGGYFEWPRESTGEELADSLDVAAPTLHNHLRVAQRKLLDAFFES
jgi:hypothetical protein